ncbi:hypothetical protein C7B77_27650 [Chamaesiphon polymorphus CCALA 037]|uniref:Uncharacterized protein n=1 Tax=Chamaesiphon polymorphus CCALA 037 TaxID=2107692 RepID=A0A2T1F818_9CYAN|nr:hypothetical protein C7B77_27650 [Chamaesiphon polymorphus CCALA 037]
MVNLSSVSSAEHLHSPELSQGNALRADDMADDLDTTDDIADDISSADDKAENIVSNRTAEHERVSRLSDDTDDKNSRSTSFVGVAYR